MAEQMAHDLRLPIIRGVVALGGSLAIGFRALEISANAQLPAEGGAEAGGDGEAPQEIPKGVWAAFVNREPMSHDR